MDPSGPLWARAGCRFFWNLLGTQAMMWSYRPVRSSVPDLLDWASCVPEVLIFYDFLLLKKHPESPKPTKKSCGWSPSSNLQKVAALLNFPLKPHGVVLRKKLSKRKVSTTSTASTTTLLAFAAISPAKPPLQLPRFDMMRSSNRLLVSLGCRVARLMGVSMVYLNPFEFFFFRKYYI